MLKPNTITTGTPSLQEEVDFQNLHQPKNDFSPWHQEELDLPQNSTGPDLKNTIKKIEHLMAFHSSSPKSVWFGVWDKDTSTIILHFTRDHFYHLYPGHWTL